jgi:hypothetical protein
MLRFLEKEITEKQAQCSANAGLSDNDLRVSEEEIWMYISKL